MGVAVEVEGLSKSFGSQNIWSDVTLTLPPGEISVLLGPSGTGKSVFLKSLVGLLKPEKGSIVLNDTDIVTSSEHKLYEIRKLFGVLFQDGALFGSMNLFDNIAFPLREHTKKSESEIKRIVLEKMDMVGLQGAEGKLPGEISGGMRKRAGLARALVLDPEIILFDEPDSGLDPVRVAYLNQLIVDLNAQIDATFLIVTHDIGTARTVPDNLGLLFRRNLVMFGPREQLLTSQEPVVRQFLNGRREGPIGMSEEKDVAQVEAEMAALEARGGDSHNGVGPKGACGGDAVPPQLTPTEGLPERKAERRRQERVARMLHEFDEETQEAIRASLPEDLLAQADSGQFESDRRVPAAGTGRPSPTPSAPTGRASAPPRCPGRGATGDGDGQAEGPRPARRQVLADPARCAASGNLFAFALDVVKALPKRPFQIREFIQQTWFIASVTILPTALVAIPFGAVIALQLGSLTRQLGAQSFTGSASVLAVLREASPIVTALLIAGAGGSAICADLGARKIRDEIDAMEVLGIGPIQRLVVPRVLASMLVAVLLNGLVSVVGVAGGYFFNVVLQGGTPGAYLASFNALAQVEDFWSGEIKALIFGLIAADRRLLQGAARRRRAQGRR